MSFTTASGMSVPAFPWQICRLAVFLREFLTTVRNSTAAPDQRGGFGSAVFFFPRVHGAIQSPSVR